MGLLKKPEEQESRIGSRESGVGRKSRESGVRSRESKAKSRSMELILIRELESREFYMPKAFFKEPNTISLFNI